MRINELKERLEKLENNLFIMNMIDRWTYEDRKRVSELEREIDEIKRELNV